MNLLSNPNLLFAAVALLACSCLTAVARSIAVRTGVLDKPDGARKLHCDPTPLMGGTAIYASLVVTLLITSQLPVASDLLRSLPAGALPMLLLSGGLFCALGLYDDIKPLKPWRKFGLQLLAALPFAIWGQKIDWVEFMGFDLTLGTALGAALTAIWLVACANTINLIDGLDGLAGTVGLIACVGIAVVADIRLLPGVAAIALVTAGSLTGFLCHNLPPARIFLGDSGSLLIGFLVGALSIEASLKTATGFAMTVPVILVSIPAFDTLMAILRRRLNGRGIGEGDRGHIHHRLQDRGLTRTQTLIVIAGLSAMMTAFTILCVSFEADRICVVLCVALLGILIVGRVFGHQETLLILQRAQRVGQVLVASSTLFGPRPLRAPPNWIAATELLQPLGITRLEFYRFDTRTDEVEDHRVWAVPRQNALWELTVSAPEDERRRLTLIAWGDSRSSTPSQIAEIFQLLDECCRGWASLGGLPAEQEALPAILPRPVPRPKLAPAEPIEPVRRVA